MPRAETSVYNTNLSDGVGIVRMDTSYKKYIELKFIRQFQSTQIYWALLVAVVNATASPSEESVCIA